MYDNIKRTIIITGGNKGIGLAITKKYLKENCKVFVGARSKILYDGPNKKNLYFVKINAENYQSHLKLAKIAKKKTKRLDLYINNVGLSEWRPIGLITNEFLNKMLSINLKSVFWGVKAATAIGKNNLSIINISSIAGKRGSSNNSAYCASKFAVNGVTQSLAKELGKKNIRVNAICPVLIKTEGLVKALNHKFSPAKKNINKFFKEFSNQNSATGTLPTAEDVASMCYYLSKKESSSITGQCINIDCGVFPQ